MRKFGPRPMLAAMILPAIACLGELGENVSVSVSSTAGTVAEGRSATFTANIVDRAVTQEEIAGGASWAISGTADNGFPVADLASVGGNLTKTARGLHPKNATTAGQATISVTYKSTTVPSPFFVIPVTVQSIQAPATLTLAVDGTANVVPVFRDSVDVSVHRHDATWSVANGAIAEVLAVTASEPAAWTIRGKAAGTTNVTVTSQSGTATIAVTVE